MSGHVGVRCDAGDFDHEDEIMATEKMSAMVPKSKRRSTT